MKREFDHLKNTSEPDFFKSLLFSLLFHLLLIALLAISGFNPFQIPEEASREIYEIAALIRDAPQILRGESDKLTPQRVHEPSERLEPAEPVVQIPRSLPGPEIQAAGSERLLTVERTQDDYSPVRAEISRTGRAPEEFTTQTAARAAGAEIVQGEIQDPTAAEIVPHKAYGPEVPRPNPTAEEDIVQAITNYPEVLRREETIPAIAFEYPVSTAVPAEAPPQREESGTAVLTEIPLPEGPSTSGPMAFSRTIKESSPSARKNIISPAPGKDMALTESLPAPEGEPSVLATDEKTAKKRGPAPSAAPESSGILASPRLPEIPPEQVAVTAADLRQETERAHPVAQASVPQVDWSPNIRKQNAIQSRKTDQKSGSSLEITGTEPLTELALESRPTRIFQPEAGIWQTAQTAEITYETTEVLSQNDEFPFHVLSSSTEIETDRMEMVETKKVDAEYARQLIPMNRRPGDTPEPIYMTAHTIHIPRTNEKSRYLPEPRPGEAHRTTPPDPERPVHRAEPASLPSAVSADYHLPPVGAPQPAGFFTIFEPETMPEETETAAYLSTREPFSEDQLKPEGLRSSADLLQLTPTVLTAENLQITASTYRSSESPEMGSASLHPTRDVISYVVTPIYPKDAVNQKIEGTVKLEVVVSPEGTVKEVEIQSEKIPKLDQHSRDTISNLWEFKSHPREYRVEVYISYRDLTVNVEIDDIWE